VTDEPRVGVPATLDCPDGPVTVAATAPTYPTHAPTRRLDHVLTAGLPPVRRVEAVDTGLSDHRALLAEW
jgi:endonuclease/exonuclease/phosphatase family metal-dependent hydrolase